MRLFGMFLITAALLAGCVMVNVDLAPKLQPYEETVLEGKAEAKVVMLDVTGMITDEAEEGGMMGTSEESMPSRLKEALDKAAKDPEVRGLILRINTPGGAVSPSDAIYSEVLAFKRKKNVPVYASILALGTSGGYYIASAADMIYAQPTSITGSIGVIAMNVNLEGLMEKLGVKDKTYASGPNKGIFTPLRADRPEEREIIQGIIDTMYGRFLDVVVEGRKGRLTRAEVARLADGRPYMAEQAFRAGLIDGVAYPGEVFGAMKAALGLKEARLVAYGRPGSYRGSIYAMGNMTGNTVVNIDGSALGLRSPGVRFMYLWDGR